MSDPACLTMPLLTPATTTLCWTIHGDPLIMVQAVIVISQSPGAAVQDGVVTRDVCIYDGSYCCYYGSYPIKVKACPDNYYVYELVSPIFCNSAYCAVVRSINTSSTAVTPVTISTVYPSVDPCYNYTVLDNPWRSTNYASGSNCDQSVTWSGWYRLFVNNVSAQIPDTCVARGYCGTSYPLWIRGGHPTVQDGVITRGVCCDGGSYCCYYGSYPIKVKACPGNYYVYELVSPIWCNSAYCAVTNISSTVTTVTPETTTAVGVMIKDGARSGFHTECGKRCAMKPIRFNAFLLARTTCFGLD
ncbi:Uromodulin [Labeo rohita]|uniref:Uromodulin n=1 Tax=Labeo rohita TaxID=84645 RepID=A0ABQ8L478_LABRO|nr:Uromodulin [Labeo rohita]